MEKPRILIKTKNLQIVFDYCIETKTEFTVIPKSSNDDWEIELNIRNIIDAIKWGMFLKANKIELVENSILLNPISISKPPTATQKNKKERQNKTQTDAINSLNQITEPLIETIEKNDTTQESILDFSEQKTSDELF
jgi:hypothetical protein